LVTLSIMKNIYKVLLIILFGFVSNVEARNKYWVAANDGTTKYWNDNANWASSRTGSPGVAYPRIGQKVIFNSRSTVDATLRADAATRRLQMLNGYTGTINANGHKLTSRQGVRVYSGTILVPSRSNLHTITRHFSIIDTGATITATNGRLHFSGSLNIRGGTLNAPSGFLTVRGNWANSGTFTHNSGTVIFNPSRNNRLINPGGTGSTKAFYNVNKVGNKIIKLSDDISLNNFELAFRGGTWKAQGNDMSVAGNWKVNNRSAYTHGNNTVTFSGSSSQEINVYPSKGDFYNLRISNTAATDSNAIVIDNTLTIDSNATLDIEGQNLTTATLINNGNLQLQGGQTVAITTMDTNSGTVTYDGTGTYTQLAAGDAYHNLTLNSSGSISLDANLDVNGDLTITDGTLDVSSNDRSINVAGNWSNNDTFISHRGTVTFDGSSTVTTGGIVADTNDFHHVILSGTSATQSTNDIDIDGNFTISSSGTWDTNGLCMYRGGTTTLGSGTLINTIPTLSSSSPTDGATGVVGSANIVLTFSEAVDVESGNIVIKKSSDDSTVETIAVTDSKITGTGTTTITINPSATLTSSTGYYLNIAATAFDDSCSNSYAGITNATTLNFTSADVNAPTLSSSSPTDGATGIAGTANIVLTFSKAVDVESGNIVIKKSSDDSTVETIAVTDSKITGTGTTTITINPSATLTSSTGYYLNIAATAFDDGSSNSYTGITDATTLNFTIADTVVPTLSSSTPADGATGVAVDANIVLTFSEAVDVESGNITLMKSDGSTVEAIDVTGSLVTGTGTTAITINPSATLASSTGYYLNIAATAFDDSSSNSYAGITNATTLNFTIADVNAPTLSSSSPSDGAIGVAVDANIVLTFSEAVDVESGNITLKKSSDDSTVETIDVAGSLVTGTGTTAITINPSADLSSSTGYYLNIAATAFDDSSSNSYAGITNATTLNFTTADVNAPTLSSSSPADGATGVVLDANIVLTFSEAVDVESGNITLMKSDGSTVETIDVTGSLVTGTGTTAITINPSADLSLSTGYYLNIAATAFDDSSSNSYAGITNATTLNFTAINPNNPPTVTFSPSDDATAIVSGSTITITFSKGIRNINNLELTNSNVNSLITLRKTNSSGLKISFTATIDDDKKIITINPTSDFSSEQVVYVAIGATVEDFFDNAISTSSVTFTTADSTAPTIVFDPEDLESPVPVTDNITLTFNEAIQNIDDSTLTSANVDSLITLKDSDSTGSNIDFNATIDTAKKVITINPDSNFSSEQIVYVAIGATVEDDSNNAISASSITFTAADSTAPNLDFTPTDSDTGIAINSDITIAFDEAIRNINNSVLTDSNVDSLIALKTTSSSGSDIAFDAVIDSSLQLITISPSSDFSSEQVIYVAIGATVEDDSNNAISASSITFTAADATAPTVAFVPPDALSCVLISSNISLTFSEAVRNPNNSEITNSNVGSLITLEYTSNSTPVVFTATIDTAKKVITINPDSDFVSGEVVNVGIESVEDTLNNAMSATSGTFCVVDSTAPVLTFSPADSSTMVDEDTDIILTFDEEIRLINDSAINNTNVDSLITLKDTNSSGSDIPFNATIDSDNKVITIDLVSDLTSEQIVYVAIGTTVEDSYNNAITAAEAIFTTGDSLPPTVKIDAVITASIATDSNITFTFSEAVRNLDDTELTDLNVGSLIILKNTDANGSNILFSATINTAKTVITIDPTSNFTSHQVVYAAIGETVEDDSDNCVPSTSKTFTAEYLATSLSNPLNEKDVVGLIEAQLETAKRFIQHSTTPVLKRMEWLRRHRDGNNLSSQGIKINFANSTLSDIANAFQLSTFVNKTADLFQNDWAIWSEGSVTVGEIDATRISSIKEIKSKGITIGIDKMIDENQMYGVAIRIENDNNDIGTAGTNLDTDGYSLSLYGTFPFSDKTYIDSILGIGLLRTEHIRKHESGTLSGERKGKQLFGSVLYGAEFTNNQFTLSPYGRLDAGYTKLSSYTDSGTIAALSYNEQKIKTVKASIGLLVDDVIKIGEVTFMPNARIEYGKDIIDSSDAVVSYIVYPNTDYTLNIDKEETDNIRLGIGADIEVEGGWLFMTDYERNQTESSGYENTISMGVSFQPNSTSEYSFSIIDGNSSNRQIGLDFDKKLSDDWSINTGFKVAQTSSSGYNNTVYFSTEMSF